MLCDTDLCDWLMLIVVVAFVSNISCMQACDVQCSLTEMYTTQQSLDVPARNL